MLRLGGWINLGLGVGFLVARDWWLGGLMLLLSPFLLSIGYRVSAVFGVKLPWVREDRDL
jgi:hypothetical protein